MTQKLLTISIAAYNSQKYIKDALDSLIVLDKMELLEVFIVDDGGTDETLKIAKEYAKKYPNTFYPVHKENGGYGSVFNYSIKHASGKYFKLLDGDDWFSNNAFDSFLQLLEQENVDVVITQKTVHENKTSDTENGSQIKREGAYNLGQHTPPRGYGHWEICYRTELIRKSELSLLLEFDKSTNPNFDSVIGF